MGTATPASLLQRLRQPAEKDAWTRFVRLYTPLLYYWARRLGLHAADAADLVQEVLLVLVETLPAFSYDQNRSFRNWLRTIVHNKWRQKKRRRELVTVGPEAARAEAAGPDPAEALADAEYRQHLARQALELMQSEFHPATWKACWETVVAGRPAAEVGAELGLSEGAVYVAKSRVLRRLRQELDGMLD
jgi:RNA polymerase sigma-70 factor (ECF subfamily)